MFAYGIPLAAKELAMALPSSYVTMLADGTLDNLDKGFFDPTEERIMRFKEASPVGNNSRLDFSAKLNTARQSTYLFSVLHNSPGFSPNAFLNARQKFDECL